MKHYHSSEGVKLSFASIDPEKCTGCRACEQVCPTGSISIVKNKEGFITSKIDLGKCVHCGKCNIVCPVLNLPQSHAIKAVYAIQHRDENILRNSSSGGAFRLIADTVIACGGIVCSCVLDESNHAVFKFATTSDSLSSFQGSKYVQSNTGDVFTVIREYLKKNTKVLFSGSPCQCAGLLNFLGEDLNSNLITADFLCHGMPSGWLFEQYINYLEKSSGKILNVRFRDKSARGWGLWFSYNKQVGNKKKVVIQNAKVNSYEYAFQKGLINNYLCYNCPFQGKRHTDFTFADYWGIDQFHPRFNKEKGVSLLSINTEQAQLLLEQFKNDAIVEKTTIENASKLNESLIKAEARPIPNMRNTIYKDVQRNGWITLEKQVRKQRYYWLYKAWYALPYWLTTRVRKLL